MRSTALKATLISVLVASTAAPVTAQPQYGEAYPDEHQADRYNYEGGRMVFERERDAYERGRAGYDRQYGPGAYERRFGPPPVWDGDRASARSYAPPPRYAYAAPCYVRPGYARPGRGTVAGDLLGAMNDLVGAAGDVAGAMGDVAGAMGDDVGAEIAYRESGVLGAVAARGVTVAARCDSAGYYYTYADTIPYREGVYYRGRRSGRYDYVYYSRERCRLAPAVTSLSGRTIYRYVRVCPDRAGRYRPTA